MASLLDGPGQIKLATLEEASTLAQRLHAVVERYAVHVKTQQETGGFRLQIQRTATPMVGLLKPQFGLIADQVSALLLVATRGASDQVKVRMLRESVAQVKTQLEIAANKVKEKHAVAAET